MTEDLNGEIKCQYPLSAGNTGTHIFPVQPLQEGDRYSAGSITIRMSKVFFVE